MEPRAILTFGDSSGNPARTKRGYEDSRHYIVVTSTMGMREAHRVDAQVQELKSKYFRGINPERVSFHGNQLLHSLIRHTGNRRLAEQKFKEALDDIVKIAQSINATINTVVMDKHSPDMSHRSSSTVIAAWAQASRMLYQDILDSPPNTYCMLMLDRYDVATNRIVSSTINKFLCPLLAGSKLVTKTSIPRPVFVDSASCNGVQLVDMIAFIAAKNNKSIGQFVELYDQLKPALSRTVRIQS